MTNAEFEPSAGQQPNLVHPADQMYAERDTADSTIDYASELITRYENDPLHKPSMLQLQRIARTLIDPNEQNPRGSIDTASFYWGTALGYAMSEKLFEPEITGVTWHEEAWHKLNARMQTIYHGYWEEMSRAREYDDDYDPAKYSIERMGTDFLEMLHEEDEKVDERYLDLIEDFSSDLTNDPLMQSNIELGFRFVMTTVSQHNQPRASLTVQEEFELMMHANNMHVGTETLKPEAAWQPAGDMHKAILDAFVHFRAQVQSHPEFSDTDDPRDYFKALQDINFLLNSWFAKQKHFDLSTEYRFSGTAIGAVFDRTRSDTSLEPFLVDEGAVIEGAIEELYVMKGPTDATIKLLQTMQPEDDPELPDTTQTPYCLYAKLQNGIVQQPNGQVTQVPEHETFFVVLSSREVKIERFMVQ